METVIKQAVGIDCGSQELVVTLGELSITQGFTCKSSQCFANNEGGFKKLQKWVLDELMPDAPILYVMEATGVYHEKLAYALVINGHRVSIVLPNKVNAFAKTCVSKKQDDLQASKVLAEFGCVKHLTEWTPPSPLFATLKILTREKLQLKRELVLIQNQLHAEETRAIGSKATIKRMKARCKLIEKQICDISKEIEEVLAQDEAVKEKVDNICTIPGVGLQTAAIVIAETNGFNLIRNSRQLVSYAGLDVIKKESGISVRGRSHISKRGNIHLRQCLHFPAFTAVKYNKPLKNLHERIVERQAIKMKGYVAVQRKLLMLIFSLWKKNEPYKCLEQPVEAALIELD
ncbi:IS110 family transposase [Sediminibacterium sp.]|uniref:IS110 family transposase n=1 Tax=Sediminibacterium sp. TaxID=1917865 RepID=UPI0025CF2118|nr:IS110 family transposase [Sediminibacterium sp.]MBW0177103.1 IS110 family transposase [Sediminibacterium sp.]